MRSNIETTTVQCNNCGRSDGEIMGRGRDHEYRNTTDDEFTFVRCPCGLVYLNPRPAVSELSTIYPPDYYAYKVLEKRRASTKRSDSAIARLFRWRNLNRFKSFVARVEALERDRPYRVLDVGCGDGGNLNMWREAFAEEPETHGVEMNERAAEVAVSGGHRVIAKRIEETDLPSGYFDFAFSFHVIEHVEDPADFLRRTRDALCPDGYLLLDTPNTDCLDFRLFRSGHWGPYHFPRHWTLYDRKTLTALAHKCGFEVVEVSYYPIAVFWVWTLHCMLSGRHRRLADKLFPPVEIVTRGSPWNVFLLTVFTFVDYGLVLFTGRSAAMRVLLRATPTTTGAA